MINDMNLSKLAHAYKKDLSVGKNIEWLGNPVYFSMIEGRILVKTDVLLGISQDDEIVCKKIDATRPILYVDQEQN